MEDKINNAHLNFACNENWDAMEHNADGKFCNKCQKSVYDLTDKNAAFFRKILEENNNSICARFNSTQLAPVHLYKPYWKKWIAAAMVFIGLSTFAERSKAQTSMQGKPQSCLPDKETVAFLGEYVTNQPEFPGGTKSLTTFIIKNFVVPNKTPDGKLVINFLIQKDGAVSDIKVIRGLTSKTDKEALRVLKLSPKWIPQLNAKTPTSYTLPILFKNGKVQDKL